MPAPRGDHPGGRRTLGGGLIGTRLALALVDMLLAAAFGGGRHAARGAQIDALTRRS